MLEVSVVHVPPQTWWQGVPYSRPGRQQKNFCRRSCCVCVEQHIFSQTQIEAEGGGQYRQWAECLKLGTTVSVQPTTGEQGTRAWTLSFDEQEASATSVGLEWCVHTTGFRAAAFCTDLTFRSRWLATPYKSELQQSSQHVMNAWNKFSIAMCTPSKCSLKIRFYREVTSACVASSPLVSVL